MEVRILSSSQYKQLKLKEYDKRRRTPRHQNLIEDIDKCENELIKAKLTDDISRLIYAVSEAFRILVASHQELTFLYNYIKGLWKDTQGDELPEIDREVVALVGIPTFNNPIEYAGYKVVFAHRPNPEGYEAKSLASEESFHYVPKCYDKGGWNQPNVRFWLDLRLPIEEGGKDSV